MNVSTYRSTYHSSRYALKKCGRAASQHLVQISDLLGGCDEVLAGGPFRYSCSCIEIRLSKGGPVSIRWLIAKLEFRMHIRFAHGAKRSERRRSTRMVGSIFALLVRPSTIGIGQDGPRPLLFVRQVEFAQHVLVEFGRPDRLSHLKCRHATHPCHERGNRRGHCTSILVLSRYVGSDRILDESTDVTVGYGCHHSASVEHHTCLSHDWTLYV